jgi:hypothetical protein
MGKEFENGDMERRKEGENPCFLITDILSFGS